MLPLYFSRVLTRSDYALAKVVGLMVALFAVVVTPYLILFIGRVFVAPDPATGLADEIGAVPRFVLQALLVAGLLGGIASLIAAWTPRRAYATATIIAVFIIPPTPPIQICDIIGGGAPVRRHPHREGEELRGAGQHEHEARHDTQHTPQPRAPGCPAPDQVRFAD